MNLEQMKAAHKAKAEAPDPIMLGPVHPSRILPMWLNDAMREITGEDLVEGEVVHGNLDVGDDSFEDLDDELEASLQDAVALLHDSMDLLGKYGQRKHPVDHAVKKEFIEMAQKIYETLDQYNLLEDTHR